MPLNWDATHPIFVLHMNNELPDYLLFSLGTADSIRNRSFIPSLSTAVTIRRFLAEDALNSV